MKSDLEVKMLRGAGWFFLVAALSIVQVVFAARNVAFISSLGLGVIRYPQAVGQAPSYYLDALAIVVFLGLGLVARNGVASAFLLGMLAYAADGWVFFVHRDYLGVAIHLLVLLGFWSGLLAANMLKENNRLMRDLAIRASLQKDRDARAALGVPPPDTGEQQAASQAEAPQAWRPGAPPSE